MTTTIRLRGPADIISVLPYHLGYRPTDSLVLVCLTGSQLGLVARVDLPPPGVDPWLAVDELLPVVGRERPDRVVLVCFESVAGTSDAVGRVVRQALVDLDIEVADRLVVRDGRWRSAECDWSCCPPEGEPLPAEEEVPAISHYIVLGRDPASTRQALAARLESPREGRDPQEDTRCAALIAHLEESRRTKRTIARFRRDAIRHWGRLLATVDEPPAEHANVVPLHGDRARPPGASTKHSGTDTQGPAAAGDGGPSSGPEPVSWSWGAVSLLDVTVRDLVIAWLCPGTLGLEAFSPSLRKEAERHLPGRSGARGEAAAEGRDAVLGLLTQLCRRAPDELAPGALTILAHVAWWHGDGALARIAVERALTLDPDYRLALLLADMVACSVRPGRSA